MRLEIPAAHHAEPAEENQHRNITQTNITVRACADGVGDGGDNRHATQHHEANKIFHRLIRRHEQGDAGQANQPHRDHQRALHLLLGDNAFLHPPQWPNSVRFVAPLYCIAIVVRQVGQDLQQPGSNKCQQCNQRVEMPLPPGQRSTNDNGGKRQR
ncbi:hypothetical protein D3C81_1665440 [compost metagenome]